MKKKFLSLEEGSLENMSEKDNLIRNSSLYGIRERESNLNKERDSTGA